MRRIIVTKNVVDLCEMITGNILLPALAIIILSIFLSGCEGAKPKQRPDSNQPVNPISTQPTTQSTTQPATQQPKTTTPEKIPDTKKSDDKNTADKPKVEDKPPTNNNSKPKENVAVVKPEPPKKVEASKSETVVKAEVGAGAKGHYGGEKHVMAPLLVPLGTYWRASEMTTYNIRIPKAMQLYKATHENKAPATHEEFMEEIIKKEMIKLPSLPTGHRYIYDPSDEQLKIAKPTN
ncbi:MAG: hypothetical protein LBT09_02250 [Planctomycetaceae bacterium]|jgi:hypothetical protein|nr:hypothetical protein [Planctomycetaceae bacterium]